MKTMGERGNAVALTLLGLAVAILVGVGVLYVLGKSNPRPVYTPDEPHIEEEQEESEVNPREGWIPYESEEYGFHIEFPQGWIVATGTLSTGDPAISIIPAISTSTKAEVFGITEPVAHVSIYPEGIAAEDVQNKSKSSTVIIEVPQASAKDYLLKTGKAWATKAIFEKHPESWTDAGFVFARVSIEEEVIEYMRGETQIAQFEFDPLTGDHMERSGFIDVKLRETQEEILRSFSFIDKGEEETIDSFGAIILPVASSTITSPVRIQGEIKEGYAGRNFSVRIENEELDVLAEMPVMVLKDSVTNGILPFDVSLSFEKTNATSGAIILYSQDGENTLESKSLRTPVLFTN